MLLVAGSDEVVGAGGGGSLQGPATAGSARVTRRAAARIMRMGVLRASSGIVPNPD
jgi:hypothetical protein